MNVQQVYKKDLAFWNPKTKRVRDNELWASATQIDGRAKVSIPATSRAVQRTNGYAAYLRFPFYVEPTTDIPFPPPQATRVFQGYPDSDGNVPLRQALIFGASLLTVTSDGNPSPAPSIGVGDNILVEGSWNNGSPATTAVTVDPTTLASAKPVVGVMGQAIPGRITNTNEQNLWLVGGNANLGSVVGFSPKNGYDFVTVTKEVDNSLTVVSTHVGTANKLFPTCCIIEADKHLDKLFYTGGMSGWALLSNTTVACNSLGVETGLAAPATSMTKAAAISIPQSGVILVTGGLNATLDGSQKTALYYDSYADAWTVPGYTLITGRRDHQMVVIDQYRGDNRPHALVVGGKSGIFSNIGQTGPDVHPIGVPINKCEIMPLGLNQSIALHGQIPLGNFIPTGSMSDGRYAFGLTRLGDGRVLVAGGIGFSPSYPIADNTVDEYNYELSSCEIFDPNTGFWTPIQSMLEPHSYCTCHYVPEANKAYVYGGYASALIEYLDLDDMAWHQSTFTMPTPCVFGSPFGTEFGFTGLLGGGHYDASAATFTPNLAPPLLM
jgi:hypothetical protein